MDILPERYPIRSREKSKSSGQYLLGRLICAIYGKVLILEEFPIPGERLWLDFYMPHHSLAFEYQGLQHDQFNKFFHTDKYGFQKSQKRDERKRLWCELNNIILIVVRGSPTTEELQQIIEGTRNGKFSG